MADGAPNPNSPLPGIHPQGTIWGAGDLDPITQRREGQGQPGWVRAGGPQAADLALCGQDHQAARLHRRHAAFRQGACSQASGTFRTQALAGGDARVLGCESTPRRLGEAGAQLQARAGRPQASPALSGRGSAPVGTHIHTAHGNATLLDLLTPAHRQTDSFGQDGRLPEFGFLSSALKTVSTGFKVINSGRGTQS